MDEYKPLVETAKGYKVVIKNKDKEITLYVPALSIQKTKEGAQHLFKSSLQSMVSWKYISRYGHLQQEQVLPTMSNQIAYGKAMTNLSIFFSLEENFTHLEEKQRLLRVEKDGGLVQQTIDDLV